MCSRRVPLAARGEAAGLLLNAWPEYFHSSADQVGQEPRTRRPKPGPRDITQAEDALLWLRWLDPADARLLWLRANRKPWKPICWELGISRATANRRWQYGIAVIVWRLNGRRVPRKRSMEFVVAQAAHRVCQGSIGV